VVKDREARFFYGYIIVASALLIMVLTIGINTTFGVFLPALLDEFSWTRAIASGAYSLNLALTGLIGIFAGKMNDQYGPRIIITVCGVLLGLGYLLMSQTNTLWQLYLFFGVIVGIGMSISQTPLPSTIARWFVKRRGMMTGIAVTGIGVGQLIMPPAVSWLISNYGWRTSYMVVGITVLILIVLAAQFLRRDPSQIGQLPYGRNELEEKGDLQNAGFSLKEAVRKRQFWLHTVAFFIAGLSVGSVLVHIVIHAVGLEISTSNAVIILAVIGGLSITGRVVIGVTSDRIGNKRALIICFALMSAAFFWILIARELWMLYLFAVIFGFSHSGIHALTSPTVAELFGLSSHGVIFGFVMLGGTLGLATGPVVTGYIFDITSSYQLAFLIYAILNIIGLILILCLKPVR
jgi:MFS family permease